MSNISFFSTSTIFSCGTFFITSPFLNKSPSFIPPCNSNICHRCFSVVHLLRHPITATVISASIPCKNLSTSFAIGISFICVLPHVGQDISVGDFLYNLQFLRISFATFISSAGSSDNDTLRVFPIPSLKRTPKSYT